MKRKKVISRRFVPLVGWYLKLECGHEIVNPTSKGRFEKAKKCSVCERASEYDKELAREERTGKPKGF